MSEEVFNPFDTDAKDVVRHQPSGRVRKPVVQESADTLARRREAAAALPSRDPNPLRAEGIEPLDGYAVLEFKRPGIQNGVYRKLKQGRYPSEARLDLHRHSVDSARKEVFEFVREALKLGLRSLLIVHGRGGTGSANKGAAVLKGYINHWLRELEDVQAFASARPEHGGTGAVYLLLRKSEAEKLENRLRFNKGRVE